LLLIVKSLIHVESLISNNLIRIVAESLLIIEALVKSLVKSLILMAPGALIVQSSLRETLVRPTHPQEFYFIITSIS